MQKRPLGKSGISVAPLALGGNVFGWTIDEKTSLAVLDAFVDFGFDLIDTANVYSMWAPGNQGGESEAIIGRWLKASGKRDRVVIATKVGITLGDLKALRRDDIVRGAEDSLRRLGIDAIDLYQSHRDDPETPLEETLAAYETLIDQGKVRAIGASNYSADRLREALGLSQAKNLPEYVSLQPEYNLYDRQGFEAELEPLCLEHGVAVIGYYSLASGFLSGKYRSEADSKQSARGAMVVKRYLNDRGLRILGALDTVAAAHHTVPAVVALAWLIQRPSVTAPIASATSVGQLAELVQAVEIGLSPQEVAQLDTASAA